MLAFASGTNPPTNPETMKAALLLALYTLAAAALRTVAAGLA